MIRSFPQHEGLLYLKSLEIAGFKSFSRPVRLEFPAGITAFVGPNGSGKSNVVEAVRWCLGEQNVRELRGQRSEDVIYAGPKRVLGSAEVSLSFEREGHDQVGWSELEISRRLYRSGESEYLINRSEARLRDVVSALHDVGIDGPRYVIINQGMADFFLSATPMERRGLLEHAAGLAGYRERRDEAQQKLARTSQNIEAVEAVLTEIEPRLRMLRRQARAVEERDEAASRLRALLLVFYAKRWEELQSRLDSLQSQVEALAQEREQANSQVQELEQETETAVSRERDWHLRRHEALEDLHKAEREHDSIKREAEQLEARLEELRATRQQRKDRADRHHEDREEVLARLVEIRESSETLEARRKEVQVTEQAIQEELSGVDDQFRRLEEEEYDSLEAQRSQEDAGNRLDEEKRHLADGLDRSLSKREEVNRRQKELAEELELIGEQLEQLQRAWTSSGRELAAAAESLETEERNLSSRQARVARLNRLVSKLHHSVDEAEHRAASLARTLSALEQEVGNAKLAGLHVRRGWEDAVAAALSEWALGEGEEQLEDVGLDDFLKWRGRLKPHVRDSALWADMAVDGWSGLNPLSAAILVEGREQAEQIWSRVSKLPAHRIGSPPLQIVSRSGERWTGFGVQAHQPDERVQRYFRAKSMVDVLGTRTAIQQRRLDVLREALSVDEGELARLGEGVEIAREAVRLARSRESDLEHQLEVVHRRRETVVHEDEELQSQLQSLSRAIEEGTERLDQLKSEQEQHARELEALRERTELIRRARGEATSQIQSLGERLLQLRGRDEVLAATQEAQQELLVAAERDARRIEDEIRVSDEQAERTAQEEELLEAQKTAVTARLAELIGALEERKSLLELVQAEQPDLPEETSPLTSVREKLSELISAHERNLAQLGQAKDEQESLRAQIREDLGIDPENLPEPTEDVADEAELRRLRARVSQYADSDPSVIEEYRELAGRQEYLMRQVNDLREASDDLREIIRTADREMTTRFAHAFEQVNQEFARVFGLMLGGGEAWMEPTEDQEGVEVRARLPGRRTRSSAAFSGGERCLVASSLLFAVQKVKPTPFCILDEVDAALDEQNVDRYLEALRDISENTQTIVVTHNRATMAAADVLYGLTMDEDGASNILSLRLDSYQTAV